MADRLFSYMVKVGADVSPASGELNKFTNNLKSKPLVIPMDLEEVSGKQTEGFAKQIREQASGLDEIITKTKILQNIDTGEKIEVAVAQTRKWVGANGELYSSTEKIIGALDEFKKTHKEIGDATGTQKVTSQQQKLNKEYENANKSIQSMSTSAEKFLSKSENMTGKQVEEAKKTASALVKLTQQWNAAYGEGRTEDLKRIQAEMQSLNKQFVIQEAGTRRGAGALRGWAENLQNAIKQTVAYTFSLGSMRVAQQAFNEALRFTVELNKEMTNIQILQVEGAKTKEQIDELAQSFNELGKEMAATTLEIAKGSVEWLRQGKTIAETQELLRGSIMLSKLGNVEAAEATEYLTSTLNSFKMEASEAVSVVDKLVAVDNIAATSTKELAVALRYVAAVAGETGVSLDQLISYIGVISSTTRLNAESIGQALKTMLTRMQDIRAGKIDEDGLGINNVAIALERVNITLMESETEFKDFGGVLEELAGKWETLNEVEQANISKAVAGVRQANMFRVLMSNMSEALEYQTEQLNSAGLAFERYEIYMESVEAKQNQLKASMEGLYQDAIKDGLITGLYDLGIELVDIVDQLGGLRGVVEKLILVLVILNEKAIMGAVASFGKFMVSLASSTAGVTSLRSAVIGLNTALGLTPFGLVSIGLGLIISQIPKMIEFFKEKKEAVEKANEAIENSSSALEELTKQYNSLSSETNTVKELVEEFEALSEITNKTEEDSRKLLEVQNELKSILPGLVGYYDDSNNFIITNIDNLKSLVKVMEEELAITKQKHALEMEMEAQRVRKLIPQLKDELAILEMILYTTDQSRNSLAGRGLDEKLTELEKSQLGFSIGEASQIETVSDAISALNVKVKETQLAIASTNNELEYSETVAENYMNALSGRETPVGELYVPQEMERMLESIASITTKVEELAELKERAFSGEVSTDLLNELDALDIAYENVNGQISLSEESLNSYISEEIEAIGATRNLTEEQMAQLAVIAEQVWRAGELEAQYSSLTSEVSAVTQAYKEQIDNGQISIETANQLISANSSLKQYLVATADGFYFNAEAARQATVAKLNDALAAYNLGNVAAEAAKGNYVLAASMVYAAEMADYQKNKILGLLASLSGLAALGGYVAPAMGGGGGGGSSPKEKTPQQLEKERLEEEIKGWEKEKKIWKDRLDAFKKYIKAQKESLKLKKEEEDFLRKLGKKNLDLAELQAEIALLALDDSEEARARRLELEKEAADLEVEIAEDKEDRKYEVQVDALDKAQDEYETFVQAQIDEIDKTIEAINELIDAIEDMVSEATGGGGTSGGYPKVGESIEDVIKKLQDLGINTDSLTIKQIMHINNMIEKWEEMGWAVEKYARLARAAAKLATGGGSLEEINDIAEEVYKELHPEEAGNLGGYTPPPPPEMHHFGGVAGSGGFAGNLRSNEVFAKLLRGEYVSSEGQMNNFMKNILPKIASEIPAKKEMTGGISVSMPITVEGNLDKDVIPDLERITNKVVKEINNSLKQRGFIRDTTQVG